MGGFKALYSITDCPLNCTGHGVCVNHMCKCDNGYIGESCQREICPGSCGAPYGQGNCDIQLQKCVCNPGWTGYNCSVPLGQNVQRRLWSSVAPTGTEFTPRAGHTMTFLPSSNSIWIFGGFMFKNITDELVKYDFTLNRWVALPQTSPWPQPRHGHAMAAFNDNFYIFGGVLEDGVHDASLWFYNVASNTWALKAVGSTVAPSAVAGHTLTLVENQWLYVIGGRVPEGKFRHHIHRIDANNPLQWEQVDILGGKELDRRIVGHSTVYHKESKSLLVFGGFNPDSAKFPNKTRYLHSFHIEKRYWSVIDYNRDHDVMRPPKEMAFHTADIMGNYMVVYGGNSHIHHDSMEVCYSNALYFYHLGCHMWVNVTSFEKLSLGRYNTVRHRDGDIYCY